MDCEKKSLKINFSSAFLHTLSEKVIHFFGEMKSSIVMSIYIHLFPTCLLRKAILFFTYSLKLYYDSFKRISSLYRGYQAAKYISLEIDLRPY